MSLTAARSFGEKDEEELGVVLTKAGLLHLKGNFIQEKVRLLGNVSKKCKFRITMRNQLEASLVPKVEAHVVEGGKVN